MARSKRSFNEAERHEMIDMARGVRVRCGMLLARLPIHGDAYKLTSDLLDAANTVLIALGAEDWRGRNKIGKNGG